MASFQLDVRSIDTSFSLKDKIYENLKDAITSMNIYAHDAELKMDERKLSEQLGISLSGVKVAIHRLRKRYRELLIEHVGDTVLDREMVDEEMRSLFAALA